MKLSKMETRIENDKRKFLFAKKINLTFKAKSNFRKNLEKIYQNVNVSYLASWLHLTIKKK